MLPLFAKVRQVCTVAHDFEGTVEHLVRDWGIGPFKCWHFRRPQLYDTTFRGRPADYSMKLAITWLGDVQWEVITPVEGPTLYREHLEAKGPGVQHLLMSTGKIPFEAAAERLARADHPFGQTARLSIPARLGPIVLPAAPRSIARPISLHFGYVDAEATLRTNIELTRYPLGLPERSVLRWGEAGWCVPAGDRDFERPLPNRMVSRVVKITIVTRDLAGTIDWWGRLAGVGPFRVVELGPRQLGHVTMAGGAPAAFEAKVAVACLDRIVLEIVQPGAGSSPHADALLARGGGVAFVGVRADRRGPADPVARAVAQGNRILMNGSLLGAGASVHLGTRATIGTDLEVFPADGEPLPEMVQRLG